MSIRNPYSFTLQDEVIQSICNSLAKLEGRKILLL